VPVAELPLTNKKGPDVLAAPVAVNVAPDDGAGITTFDAKLRVTVPLDVDVET